MPVAKRSKSSKKSNTFELVLEPLENRVIAVRLLSGSKVFASVETSIGDHRSGAVLDVVVDLLNKAKVKPSKLTGVAVIQGQGTFTMARLVVAVVLELAQLRVPRD